ncbi:hypothetical protein BDW72DRAFT_179121 [Aspergillus terricola var. indicus]
MFRGNNRHPSSACGYFSIFGAFFIVRSCSEYAFSVETMRFYERLRIDLSEPARPGHRWGPNILYCG